MQPASIWCTSNTASPSSCNYLWQVYVAAFRNRNLRLPENPEELYEIHMDKEVAMEVEYLPHRDIFRFGASVLHCLFFFLVYKSPPSIALLDVTKSKTHQN